MITMHGAIVWRKSTSRSSGVLSSAIVIVLYTVLPVTISCILINSRARVLSGNRISSGKDLGWSIVFIHKTTTVVIHVTLVQ